MSRTSSFGAPTQVRCGAAVSAVDSWIWVTMLCVRVRVEPSAPYVTETNRGCKGRSRSIDRHSVCSIASSFGGKNSKETVGRTRCLATALPIRSFSCRSEERRVGKEVGQMWASLRDEQKWMREAEVEIKRN